MRRMLLYGLILLLLFEFAYIPGKVIAATNIYQPSVAMGSKHSLVLMPNGTVKGVGNNSYGQVGYGTSSSVTLPADLAISNIRQVAAGGDSSFALTNKGEVYAWGRNNYGQLGTGNTTQVSTPKLNGNLSGGVEQIAAGEEFALALMKDGTVKTWGRNNYGQLGNGTTTDSASPVTIPGLKNVKRIAAGSYFVLALLEDGTVKSWGYNNYGQLGLGHTDTILTPVAIAGLSNIRDIAAGQSHAVAVTSSDTVRTWGYNSNGQLGNNSTVNALSPIEVTGLSNVFQATAGNIHTVAVLKDGKVKAWGGNSSYQLGISGTSNKLVPTDLVIDDVLHAAAGYNSTFFIAKDYTLKATGANPYYQLGNGGSSTLTVPTVINSPAMTIPIIMESFNDEAFVASGPVSSFSFIYSNQTLKAFGFNSSGQLGLGSLTSKNVPTPLENLPYVKQLATGSTHTLALMSDGTVKAWGSNTLGQLGLGNTTSVTAPVPIPGLVAVQQVAAGNNFSLALMEDGTVKAWGYNLYGQLGIGGTSTQTAPVTIAGLNGVKQLAAGYAHSMALLQDGTVKVWGYNSTGQLGLGHLINATTPAAITGLSNVVQLAAGSYHSMALINDGSVKAWGQNTYGQLGIGTTANQTVPTVISELYGVKQLAAGGNHSLALMEGGTIKGWGLNMSGQLALAKVSTQLTPATIVGVYGVSKLAAGSLHTLVLLNNGAVQSWGANSNGELGVGSYTDQASPMRIAASSVYRQVAAGYYHTVALQEDGTVKSWGYNTYGQLGIGNSTSKYSPVAVNGLTGVKQVAAGDYHAIALMSDGTVKVWGRNNYGQLGLGDTTTQYAPIAIPNLSGVKAVAAGGYQSFALMEDGTVRAWGYNSSGQLGIGNTTTQTSPMTVANLSGVLQLAAGSTHTLALMNDGTVKAWGGNSSGQLGLGHTTTQTSPATVTALSGVKQLIAGASHSLAIMSDNSVQAWGGNSYGQLGVGNTTNQTSPVAAILLSKVKKLAAGSNFSIAQLEDGTIQALGYNTYGQLGNGNMTSQSTPVTISGISNVQDIAAGTYYTFVVLEDGSLKSWGQNIYGQLGIGSTTSQSLPSVVSNSTSSLKIKQLTGGNSHSLALLEDGTVRGWGDNGNGQLGIGNTVGQRGAVAINGISGVKQLSAGASSTSALLEDGTVKAWGYNVYGQLGIGSTLTQTSPVTVPGLTGVLQLVSGYYHTLALMNDGTVKAWGYNIYGQLGIGNITNQSSPVTIPGLTGVAQLVAGDYHTLALMNDGTVKAWGYNNYGQLGIGNTINQSSPITIPGLTGAKQLVAGAYYTLVLLEDGSVKAWGQNASGQLGIGTATTQLTPVTIQGMNTVKQLAAGSYHSLALLTDGSVKGWGQNSYGQLGFSNTASVATPELLPLQHISALSTGAYHSFAITENDEPIAWGRNSNSQLGTGSIASVLYDNRPTAVMVYPIARISGRPDSLIKLKVHVDQSAEPIDERTIILDQTDQYYRLNGIDVSNYSYGAHTVKIQLTDGTQTVEQQIPFFNNQFALADEQFTVEAALQSLTIKTAVDGLQLDSNPFNIIVGEQESGWIRANQAQSYTVNGLQPNTSYTVEVQVKTAGGEIFRSSKTVATLAQTPVLSIESKQATTATIVISDSNPPHTPYQIRVGNRYVAADYTLTSEPTWISVPDKKLILRQLDASAQYSVSAMAHNEDGIETILSSSIELTMSAEPPIVPLGFKAAAEPTQIALQWDPVPNATSYQIERNGTAVSTGAQTSYLHTNLTKNTVYVYRVRAINGSMTSEWSTPLSVRTTIPEPAAPVSVNGTATARTVTLTWSQVDSAVGYELEWDGQIIKLGARETSYKILDLSVGSQHVYRVRAVNLGGVGAWSAVKTIATLNSAPAVPQGLTGTAADVTATIAWNKLEDATYYEVMSKNVMFRSGANASMELNGLKPGTTYLYNVRAGNEFGMSQWSETLTITTYQYATPKLTVNKVEDNSIAISWAAIAGALQYEIERNGSSYVVAATSLIQEGLTAETSYQYRIRALGATGMSNWSALQTITTLPAKPVIPEEIYAVSGKNYITLNWKKVEGATGYEVEIDGKVIVDNFNATTYTDDQLEAYTEHSYRIRAVTEAVQGNWTDMIYLRTQPEKPGPARNIVLQSSSSLVTIAWEAEPSATKYEIEVNGQLINLGIQNTYTHRRVTKGSENRYRIRITNGAGVGQWTPLMVNNTITARLEKGKAINLGLTASNVTDFSKYELNVYYDPGAMSVKDLSMLTGEAELTTGRIKGTDIIITEFSPGKITFVTDKAIKAGESWTGVLNSIKFQALVTGGSSITYTVFQQQ